MIELTRGEDVICPYCNSGINIVWDNECGNPEPGHHEAYCPSCNKPILIIVSVVETVFKRGEL